MPSFNKPKFSNSSKSSGILSETKMILSLISLILDRILLFSCYHFQAYIIIIESFKIIKFPDGIKSYFMNKIEIIIV